MLVYTIFVLGTGYKQGTYNECKWNETLANERFANWGKIMLMENNGAY